MPKRAGDTVKISISLPKDTVTALRRHAKRLHGGNVSAVVAEMAEDMLRLEAMDELIEDLGGPSLTPEATRRIEEELAGHPVLEHRAHAARPARAKTKRRRRA